PAEPFQIHMLAPEGVYLMLYPLPGLNELEEPEKPHSRTFTYQVPMMPIGKPLRVRMEVSVPRGYTKFKVPFSVTSPQLETTKEIGSLTVIPPKYTEKELHPTNP